MKYAFTRQLAGLITGRPGTVAIVLVLLTAFAGWRVSELRINNNQLDLIPQDLPSVEATKQMVDVIGGIGFLLIAFKADNPDHLKAVADDLAPRLSALEEVRSVTYKQDVAWVRERLAMYIATPDLEEGYRRVKKKLRAVLRKNNPFHIELTARAEEPLVLDDLIAKYRSINKKGVDDNYYIDDKKEMILFAVKPTGDANDLAFTRHLLTKVEQVFAHYSKENTRGARLAEGYKELVPGATVTYGYTGGFKRNLDDSDTMTDALTPVSFVSFAGILLCLMVMMRRIRQIAIVMVTLLIGVVWTYAFCELTIGQLNTITALLGAILMGMGIDYGIQFTFRLREEYVRTGDLTAAIHGTFAGAGPASLASALTTAVPLFILMISDFLGFSHFGWVMGMGLLMTAGLMYVTLPVTYLLIDRVAPGFKESLRIVPRAGETKAELNAPYPFARRILIAGLALSAVLAIFMVRIQFDYDARSLMTADLPSVVLQDEINKRFQISSDPVGIYTETLDEARALYDALTPLAPESSIDAVISPFTLVPSAEQQAANRRILDQLQADLTPIKPEMLEEKERAHFEELQRYIGVKPFGLEDLPPHIAKQFRPVPTSKLTGYVTFVYPKVSLWDGRELLTFANEIGTVQAGGRTYHSAGMAPVFADLARIVLRDGQRFAVAAALAVLFILLVAFRSAKATFLTIVPLVASSIWMLGLMALTDWRINFMNIVVFPQVFGYGMSGGIYIFHRFRESGSARLAVVRTGVALAASSITTLVGWGALLISGHRGLESMGVLACLGIASALIASLTLLPALLQTMQGKSAQQQPAELARKSS